jgi:hypothetical protein
MPLPIVHLGVARNLAGRLKINDLSSFYLGSIAPDAVHMRDGYTRAIKHKSHLYCADTDVRRRDAAEFIRRGSGGDDRDFRCGYGIHLLTDSFWNKTVVSMFDSRYGEDKSPAQDAKSAYYNDMDQLDFELYKKYPHRAEIWGRLLTGKAAGVDGLVSAEEVDGWKQRTLHWYDSGESRHTNPVRYIQYDDVLGYITNGADMIYDYLCRADVKVEP